MAFSPVLLGTGVAGYNFLTRTRETQQSLLEQSPEITREVDNFAEGLANVESADDLMDNYQMFKVALGAFGLEEDIGSRGFIKQVLESDTNDSTSFVNRLTDTRYLEFARAFNFGGTGGPDLEELNTVDDVKAKVDALASADELLADGDLLRATLDTFGLSKDQDNKHFLKLVLESDLSDEDSFANRLSDKTYANFAQSFGFGARISQQESIYGFADLFVDELNNLQETQDLLEKPELLASALKMFGLEGDVDDTEFWTNVFDSDVTDDNSFANQLDDPRYAALSRAFGFGEPEPAEGLVAVESDSKLEVLVNALDDSNRQYSDAADFFTDFPVLLATLDFLDLPRTDRFVPYAGRVLSSDLSDPTSLINLEPDPRYAALAEALNFPEPEPERTFPDGFADAIAQRYIDKQFETLVGETDGSMRIALSLAGELDTAVTNGSSNDSRWFAVMASSPLRAVFENIFQLPSSFGTLDIDQQLTVFKQRSEKLFGTEELSDLNTDEFVQDIREQYLSRTDILTAATSSSASVVLALLAG
ncbi:MAG: DUF1217 domain-containing protein [Aliishimia sp.]